LTRWIKNSKTFGGFGRIREAFLSSGPQSGSARASGTPSKKTKAVRDNGGVFASTTGSVILNSLVVAGTGNRLAQRSNSSILIYPAIARVH